MYAPLLLALALLLGVPAASGQTIHLLTIADSNDSNIGSGTAGNTRAITEFVIQAASEMKLTISKQDVSGKAFSCQKIKEAIQLLNTGSDDVVIFYYSGHGFRTSSNATKFPELFCGAEAFTGAAPLLLDVADQLASKGAKLTIVVADSCNVMMTTPAQPKSAGAVASTPTSRVTQYRNLFLHHKGTITMSGSVVGQFSWYLPTGGLFTDQLLAALEAATQPGQNGLWSDVMTVALAPIQVPYGTTFIPQSPESDVRVEVSK